MQEPPDWVNPPDDPGISNASIAPIDWRTLLPGTKNGGPFNNLENVVLALETSSDLKGKIWYDSFLDGVITTWAGPERRWKDVDDVLLQFYMQSVVGLKRIGVQACHDAALMVAFRHQRNECKDYLQDLKWDQKPRLEILMHWAFGAEESPYSAAVGRCWFISMVARVMQPGCKVDTVPVLEGSQGAGKSTALGIIGGKWFVECHEPISSKDFFGVLDGHMIVEISEMHSFNRSEIERVKGLISCPVDRYRKAYGRNAEDHPRQTVLVCTTNRDDWQKDDTGARRFWAILCGLIDLEWLKLYRDQLFAEAVVRFNAGESWWDVPEAAQVEQAEMRRESDTWEHDIEHWIIGKDAPTTADILKGCFGLESVDHDVLLQRRLARCMRVLGYKMAIVKDSSRRSLRIWRKISVDNQPSVDTQPIE